MTNPDRDRALETLRGLADRAAMRVQGLRDTVRIQARRLGLTKNELNRDEMAAVMFAAPVIMRHEEGPMVHTTYERDGVTRRLPGGQVVELKNTALPPSPTEVLHPAPGVRQQGNAPNGNITVWDVAQGSPKLVVGTRSRIIGWIRDNSAVYLANGKGVADERSPTRATDRYLMDGDENGLFIGVLAQQVKPASESSRVNVINPRTAAAKVMVGDAGGILVGGVNAVAHAPNAIAETARTVNEYVKTVAEQGEAVERFGLLEREENKEEDTGIYSLSFHSAKQPQPDRQVYRIRAFPAPTPYQTADGIYYIVRIGELENDLIGLLDELFEAVTGQAPRPIPLDDPTDTTDTSERTETERTETTLTNTSSQRSETERTATSTGPEADTDAESGRTEDTLSDIEDFTDDNATEADTNADTGRTEDTLSDAEDFSDDNVSDAETSRTDNPSEADPLTDDTTTATNPEAETGRTEDTLSDIEDFTDDEREEASDDGEDDNGPDNESDDEGNG